MHRGVPHSLACAGGRQATDVCSFAKSIQLVSQIVICQVEESWRQPKVEICFTDTLLRRLIPPAFGLRASGAV